MKTLTRALVGALLGSLAFVPFASAQTYPIGAATYQTTPLIAPVTLTAAGNVVFNTNGLGSMVVRVLGTNTGVAATIQGTTERAPSTVTWSTIGVEPIGGAGGMVKNIVGDGAFRVNTAGFAQIQFNLSAISTGSVVVDMSGTPAGPTIVSASPARRVTYSASVVALAPAAATTDFLTLTGSASVTVRVSHVECSGISTANATATIEAVTRSTANSAGTSAAMTAVAHDPSDPAASGTALSYTANPTIGTLVGIVRAGKLTTTTAATSSVGAQILSWDFGNRSTSEDITLRGIAQVFALNGAAGTFSAGTALNCSIEWTEE